METLPIQAGTQINLRLPKQTEIYLLELVLEWMATGLETVTAHASAQTNLRLPKQT